MRKKDHQPTLSKVTSLTVELEKKEKVILRAKDKVDKKLYDLIKESKWLRAFKGKAHREVKESKVKT